MRIVEIRPWAKQLALVASLVVLGTVGSGCGSAGNDVDASNRDRGEDGSPADGGLDARVDAAPDADGGPGDAGPDGQPDGATSTWPDCDPMVPTLCGLPYPSNIYLRDDDSTPTGKRLALPMAVMPKTVTSRRQGDPAVFNLSDGFSPSVNMITHMPGATTTGLPTPLTIDRSLEADSPTVIIEAETGERVPHFSELDVQPLAKKQPDRSALLIRPVVRLKDGTRYIVAIRNIVDADGKPLPASPIFAALRDDTAHPDPSVAARRDLYDDIFERLAKAGVERSSLQIAWDFTTASTESLTGWMLHMRNVALAQAGQDGPPYVIDDVEEPVDPGDPVQKRIEGRITVPLFLDRPGPGGRLNFGEDGMPAQNGTAEYPFIVLIPRSATQAPAKLLQVGHGLFGSRQQVEGFRDFANQQNYVLFALDWIGMSSEDPVLVVDIAGSGQLQNFATIPDRLHQAMVNYLLAMRMMSGAFARDPEVQLDGRSAIDPTQRYYLGGSQGGILGAVYMALTTDIERGILGVPGQPYNLLLPRSVDYDPYRDLLVANFDDPLAINLILALFQQLWDRAEPGGYSHHIELDPLPDTPSHRVLLQIAIGDHQVSTLGAHIMARAIGAKNLLPVNRNLWGIEEVAAPYSGGSAMIEYEFGLPPEPITNVPQRAGQDPHGRVADIGAAVQAAHTFLTTGVVEQFCEGPCDSSD